MFVNPFVNVFFDLNSKFSSGRSVVSLICPGKQKKKKINKYYARPSETRGTIKKLCQRISRVRSDRPSVPRIARVHRGMRSALCCIAFIIIAVADKRLTKEPGRV